LAIELPEDEYEVSDNDVRNTGIEKNPGPATQEIMRVDEDPEEPK